MAWSFEGTYLENCNCTTICPCTWSALTAPATNERCNVLLAFHIDRGEVDGVDVSGLTFGMLIDSAPIMAEGGWRMGLFLDAAADDKQTEKLAAVLGGGMGGPPAMLGPLLGEMLGMERVPIEYRDEDGTHSVRFGDLVDIEVKDYVAGEMTEPVRLTNMFHPANTTLTLSPATRSRVDAFGIGFDGTGKSGCNAPFAWSA